jgi:hypothetical protein
MTPDQYINSIVQKHKLPEALDSDTTTYIVAPLKQIISNWAGVCLCETKLSGSRAKGTAIDIATDLDLFISLSSTTQNSLKEIYDSLYNRMIEEGITARKQNVSIGVTYQGKKVDLVPAKRQSQFGNDHSLYRRKADSWTKTNIDTHISRVRQSKRITEIIALKIWRENHGLEFPSILLECFAIDSLYGRSLNAPADNFLYLLRDIQDNIQIRRIVDPSNTNNILSEDLTQMEKKALSDIAQKSLAAPYWDEIIW